MTYQSIINAAPMTIMLGTRDMSGRPLPRVPEAIPTHLPKVYHYAQRGIPGVAVLAAGGERASVFGIDTYDAQKKWHNHATELSNLINAEGNACMYERVVPTDIGPRANFLLSLDILEHQVTDFQRNTDGSFKRDSLTNLPIPVAGAPGTIAGGFSVKWVVTALETNLDAEDFGQATIGPGTQTDNTDPMNPVTSLLVPWMEFSVQAQGADGNNSGLRIWSPNDVTSGMFDRRIMQREKVYPFRLQVVRRNTVTGTPKVIETIFGDQHVLATLKPKVNNPITTARLSVADVFLDSYNNTTDPRYPAIFGDFGAIKMYDANIALYLKKFADREQAFIAAFADPEDIKHDFSSPTATGEEYLFNAFNGTTSFNYPYHTFQFVTGGVTLGEHTNIYARGGSDGTMNDTLFAELVAERVEEYADLASDVQNSAINVESIIYDSGFPLATKYALTNFLAYRKDTFVVLGTHEVGGLQLTASEDNALAIALRTRLQMFPESEFFGTATMRGMVMGRSGRLRNSLYRERVSPLFEVAIKAARYMGAGDGRWKTGKNFDGAPGSILDYITDISVAYTPASVRNRDWDAGLNWVQSFDRQQNFFPALKTVYNDDTSVLNSFTTAMAIVEIQKVCERAWRYFSGTDSKPDGVFTDRVSAWIRRELEGRFDGRYVIEPNAYYTDADVARGYSWTVNVDIYSPSMKTVQTTMVTSRRLSDYVATTA